MVRKQSKSNKAKKEQKLCPVESRITRSTSTAVKNIETIKTTELKSTKNLPQKSATKTTRSKPVNSERVASDPIVKSPKITRSKSEKNTNIDLNSGSYVKDTPQNSTTKNLRSKSVNSETELLISQKNTCSSPNFSPKRTRSQSEKITNIHFNSDFNNNQRDEQKKKQSENSTISLIRYVKLSDFCLDSIVLAKQKYAAPWPARVLKIEKNTVFVCFFGDKRSGYVKKPEIYDFVLSANAIKHSLKSKKIQRTYKCGIREVEMLIGIPRENSLLNEI